MQGGGLIYVAIIALWAIVLVPMWLRRHDQASEMRGVDRFNNAMRSLRRRNAHALEFSRSRNVEVAMAKNSSAPLSHDPARKASNRRALVLAMLSVLLVITLAFAFMGIVPVFIVVIPAVLLGTFLVASAMTSGHRIPDQREEPQRVQSTRRASATVSRSQYELRDQFFDNQFDEDAWDAEPAPPLPTYVTAPRASAVPRAIDRQTPGEWTGAAMVEQAKQAQAARGRHAQAVADFEAELDETSEIPLPRVAGQ